MRSRTERRVRRALLALPILLVAGQALAEPLPLIGDPYVIDGRTYTPADAPLDEVGYAGIITGHGGTTASGERYVSSAIVAAHRTLPVPSFVEVTSIATGRTILVRVNERGPFVGNRAIDLSCGAARQLGLTGLPAAVRVRRVAPTPQEQAALASGAAAPARLDAPAGLVSALRRKLPPAPASFAAEGCALGVADNAPPPAAAAPVASIPPRAAEPHPAPPPSAPPARGAFAIQVAALSSRAAADSLARRIGGHVEPAGGVFRVRTGPYATEVVARAALPQIRAKGFADAHVVPNGGR